MADNSLPVDRQALKVATVTLPVKVEARLLQVGNRVCSVIHEVFGHSLDPVLGFFNGNLRS